jgi:predicted esterase
VELQPRLLDVVVPSQPRGIVLVLHGGGSREDPAVSPWQPSVLRMVPVAHAVGRAAGGQLAIFRLLNARRGWEPAGSRVGDAVWALNRALERVGSDLPACLVGHSLGGRAALMAAGHPAVRSSVALAPWVEPSDLATAVDGRRILVIHGTKDRVARLERARQLAGTLSRQGAEVTFIEVRGGTHAMLAHRRHFDGLAAQFAALTLLGDAGGPTMRRVAAGERSLQI